uniref:Tetratricopeptide repeat protein 30 n=1 Tax=Chromera velia CCMP2878 TaxID=1169474 RepID=A0A0G4HAD3_9ALVE|eukprot:Cvel_882.t1-p1 / transcript=Cvel_882.t1 / gene=Cvel_882 / organism=Chromera_velia_CCMP2878 / gene_product=Tetratricopeptide repeat protein 30A, putative / transcript_product=Tetratricopeptide repeat protein 30A, putative / location=Cvel_scaffold28:13895-21503(+) / protein_length=668 / sequence_SO=supercontig / SO=protein_coding / is_pseudo=false
MTAFIPHNRQVPDGQYTEQIYSFIGDQKYENAIRILQQQVNLLPSSRAGLSLLAYCYYMSGDFLSAAQVYATLCDVCPEIDAYKLYQAQALMKSGLHDDALRVSTFIDSEESTPSPNEPEKTLGQQVRLLQATIRHEQEEVLAAHALLDSCETADTDVTIMRGSLLWKEKRVEEAKKAFLEAAKTQSELPALKYNIALCHYSMKQYGDALKNIAEIIEAAERAHPELGVGVGLASVQNQGGDSEYRSVGNSLALQSSALVEAFNLKAAIEFLLNNKAASKEALLDMPPRNEEELDPVTLHNIALMNMDEKPTDGFRKLNFLLQSPDGSFPRETFVNLLLLYCKYEYFDLAADLSAEHAQLTYSCLEPDEYDFLESLIMAQNAPREAYKKLEELANGHMERLRKSTKQIAEARRARDNAAVRRSLGELDASLAKFIPVLMGQAKIYWDLEDYAMVEKIFSGPVEYVSDQEVWKLNLAHVFFMEEKYREAIRYYEPFVKKHTENVLNVTAVVLANLCVSFIMTSANEDAEELMRLIEKEEERVQLADPTKNIYHLCIVNLVIGTLYCAKGNFEFGISRVIKSLEPASKKLGTDTWYYAKRCFLALGETLAKHMILLKDQTYHEILAFLDLAIVHGTDIQSQINPLGRQRARNTVAFEAKLIKRLFLRLRE